ncbi:mitochondrial outer membrane import complex protein METAXIN-like [Quillaja saponaria]|uniref:Mitochondrial outer membrane import complex protein METAXIN-like n=1 Tax=Quillaja saponaria TaxID=32244 RepID=A0AAD7LCX8_QUISA|nr:mitochondrial outer membrane import complex protein METAXIN-like [Quillaja saponaria]
MEEMNERESYTLVVRKPCFGLPTACPSSLSVYIYLKFAQIPFHLDFNLTYPDSDQIPYFEAGNYVAYHNEGGGVIECLKRDDIVDLDTELLFPSGMDINKSDGQLMAYRSIDIRTLGGKFTQVKQQLGITKDNIELKEKEIYRRANIAYQALSTRLGEQNYFDNRPSSLDAIFLAHALITLQALHETSVLRSKLLQYDNLVRYADKLKAELIEAGSSSSSAPHFQADPLASTRSRGPSNSKPKSKPKRQKTEEEKTFKRRGKYFVAAQLVAIFLFLSFMGRADDAEVEFDDNGYDD